MLYKPIEKIMRWYEFVNKWCMELQVSQSLILAIIQQESHGNEKATRYEPIFERKYIASNEEWLKRCKEHGFKTKDVATSYGLMQIMFSTAWGYGARKPEELFNPDQNIRFGTALMADHLKKYTIQEALAVYNGGEGAIKNPTSMAWRYSKIVFKLFEEYKEFMKTYKPTKA